MNNFMSKFLKSSIISAIGLAILGILLVFESELTIVSISYVIGAILVAIGTVAILNFVNDMKKNVKNELNIVYGIGMVVLGIIVISNPKGVASIIPFILGVLIIINSAAKLQYSLELKKDNNKLWNSTMIMALITLLCGLLLVFNPFSGAEFITKVVGVLLFIYAITDIVSSLRIRKTVKNIQKVIENNTVKEAEVIEDKTKENKSEEE